MIIRVSDNATPSLSATQSFVVFVTEVNSAPTLLTSPSRTIHQGVTLTASNSAMDLDLPPNILTYSLSNAPPGANIDLASGVFTWTPTPDQAPTTNLMTVIVTDNGSPALSDQKPFQVIVLSQPLIKSISLSVTNVEITWSAIAGTRYRLQKAGDPATGQWSDASPVVSATGDTASKTDLIENPGQHFYRILVVP